MGRHGKMPMRLTKHMSAYDNFNFTMNLHAREKKVLAAELNYRHNKLVAMKKVNVSKGKEHA